MSEDSDIYAYIPILGFKKHAPTFENYRPCASVDDESPSMLKFLLPHQKTSWLTRDSLLQRIQMQTKPAEFTTLAAELVFVTLCSMGQLLFAVFLGDAVVNQVTFLESMEIPAETHPGSLALSFWPVASPSLFSGPWLTLPTQNG